MTSPRAVSLFSGCGGADLGLIDAGFDVVFANDISETAMTLYKQNIPDVDALCADIRDIRTFPQADLLAGCYPCQGFSQGGTRQPESTVNYLYREFDRALRLIRPKAFLVENVAGMTFGQNKMLLRNQLVRFRAAGYRVSWSLVDAKDYGVPQTRRRIFIVGIRSDLGVAFDFPAKTHGPGSPRRFRTQRDAIARLPEWPAGQFCEEAFHWYYLSRRRRHDWDEPSACIVGHWRHVPLHPSSPPLVRLGTDEWEFSFDGRARRLSLTECAQLQCFPRRYSWEGVPVKQAFKAVGNAVPPRLTFKLVTAIPDIW